MASHSCLAADADEILKDRRPGNAYLCHNDTAPAKEDVVPDLHQIIETRASADHRVSHRSPVNRRIGANLHIVFQITRPSWGTVRNPALVEAKPNPSCPMRAPA